MVQDHLQMRQASFFADLAGLVIYHRKRTGLSRLELARIAGVGKTSVYDIEHAKQTVRLDTLIKVLTVLNITMELKGPLMQSYRETLK